jgi:hypothetical protein
MERDFKQWLALFRTSIANYQYYTYFDKVFSNVDAIIYLLYDKKELPEDIILQVVHILITFFCRKTTH